MNVLFLSTANDTAGLGVAMKRAFDQWGGDWQARAVRRWAGNFSYPADAEWGEVDGLIAEADVIHLLDRTDRMPDLKGKPLVIEHLGTYFRRDPQGISAQCQRLGALEVAGGLDLMLLPYLRWLPIPVDLDTLAALRVPNEGILRIAHAPTNRALKSTDQIIAAVKRLARKVPIDFDIIEGVPWQECLVRKGRSDIFVDELTLGYGLNALECWVMGIPVVSGIADPVIRARMIAMFGELPFTEATAETLYDRLAELVVDERFRRYRGEIGRRHALRWHSPRYVVGEAIALYEQLR